MSSELVTYLAKPATTAAVAGAADYFFLGQKNIKNAAVFGASIGGAVLIADAIGNHALGGGAITKSLERRALEIGLTSGAGIGVYMFLDPVQSRATKNSDKLMAIIGSEIVADYIVESFVFKSI